jgi:hypothetical protein
MSKSPSRCEPKTIRFPSGDTTGSASYFGLSVMRRAFEPSASAIKIS